MNLTTKVVIGPRIRCRALALQRKLLEFSDGRLIPALARDIAVEAGMGEQAFGDFRVRHGVSAGFENNLQ